MSLCHIEFICRSDDNYQSKLKDVDWVVVATPNDTHYEIVKNCLWFGKNVFCEKPLTPTYEQSEKLFRLAEMRNVKLYVDDIQNYREYDFEIQENNLIERRKSGGGDIKDILYLLTYHDLYILYKYIKNSHVNDVIPIELENKLQFKVKFDDINIKFIYDLNSEEKEHYINGCSLAGNDNIIPKMLSSVFNGDVDFEYNKEISMFSNKFIDMLNEKLWRSNE